MWKILWIFMVAGLNRTDRIPEKDKKILCWANGLAQQSIKIVEKS